MQAKPPLSLTIAISTLGSRVEAIAPEFPGPWHWVVLVQRPDQACSAHLGRLEAAGAEVVRLSGTGVAQSRNAAIARAESDLLLFGDDDVTLDHAALRRLETEFRSQPQQDLLAGQLCGEDGLPHKRYSRNGTLMRPWNIAKVGTPELALRLGPVRAAGLRFDEGFGAGTPLGFGEEFIFLADALRAGLCGRHHAIVIGRHAAQSSGLKRGPGTMAIRRKVFTRALGSWGWIAFQAHRLRETVLYSRGGKSS